MSILRCVLLSGQIIATTEHEEAIVYADIGKIFVFEIGLTFDMLQLRQPLFYQLLLLFAIILDLQQLQTARQSIPVSMQRRFDMYVDVAANAK